MLAPSPTVLAPPALVGLDALGVDGADVLVLEEECYPARGVGLDLEGFGGAVVADVGQVDQRSVVTPPGGRSGQEGGIRRRLRGKGQGDGTQYAVFFSGGEWYLSDSLETSLADAVPRSGTRTYLAAGTD